MVGHHRTSQRRHLERLVTGRDPTVALIDAADELDRLDAIARCPMCDADGWLWGAGEDGDPIRCDHQTD
ncbi:MAG: hypothetical protein QOF31_3174 [Mycobacterium sp.]|jgi:hypothetical protein|nr:hypothetical protein [Mycobacterium sp.]